MKVQDIQNETTYSIDGTYWVASFAIAMAGGKIGLINRAELFTSKSDLHSPIPVNIHDGRFYIDYELAASAGVHYREVPDMTIAFDMAILDPRLKRYRHESFVRMSELDSFSIETKTLQRLFTDIMLKFTENQDRPASFRASVVPDEITHTICCEWEISIPSEKGRPNASSIKISADLSTVDMPKERSRQMRTIWIGCSSNSIGEMFTLSEIVNAIRTRLFFSAASL